MRSLSHLSVPGVKQHGFSMLEVLITLVIIAIALLGTAGLQLNAMRMNKGGQFRTQAVFLASDITERIEANKAAAVLGAYVVANTAAASVAPADCAAVACNSANLAAWDISQWETSIINLLPPGATWQICIDANSDQICDALPVLATPITYTIIIRWTDRSNVKSVNTGTIVDSYTATRTY